MQILNIQELQPRARERQLLRIQIDRIAYNVQPEKLGDSADISVGAPIVGNDNIVESGNARVIGLKKMYQASQKNAEKYINWLRENADKFEISPACLLEYASLMLTELNLQEKRMRLLLPP